MQQYIEAKVRDARFWNQLGVMRRRNGDEGAERAFGLAREAIRLARTNCKWVPVDFLDALRIKGNQPENQS